MLMKPASPLDQPRAVGTARVSAKWRDGRSHIGQLHNAGAMKLLFPRRIQDLQATLVNTAGGITGGDRFSISATAEANATLTMTTQAAERVYRAQAGQTGRLETRLQAAEGATLNWLPQETILFEGAALHRTLDVELHPGARFLMVEPLIFGRAAMGEVIRDLRFDDRIRITRAGTPIYRDGLHLWGDVQAQLERPGIAGGARAMTCLVTQRPDAEALLSPVRGLIGAQGGASLLQENVLVMRLLAEDGFGLRARLLPVLDLLTDNNLPLCWRL